MCFSFSYQNGYHRCSTPLIQQQTLSYKAVKWRFFDFLYKYKTNMDLPMPNKQTKLMQYVQNGHLDIVKKLVSYTNSSSSSKKMCVCVCVC